MTDINPEYALNPLLDIEAQQRPVLVEVAKAEETPPTMWATGDLPPFTASGLDPQLLAMVPWQIRHAAALEPDRAKVLAMVEDGAGLESLHTEEEHEGLRNYRERVNNWLSGKNRPKDQPLSEEENNDFYESLYGA
ncbi:hypothetical protein [Pseudarthrobacter phenanthrenivorans]|uniref:Uncharacterized protein n=1 Tax=Pseudarthrobacter phenanthrenivorans TaxID=361575 RepID=A0A0B4CYV2_PSEPS|nr:hypothetical protein [Pseudarthrobacter phenanthrenivorans]KIC66309.1 hypothetical protein RM50_12305 [Pseudarthrobacter phenanthrenivorans]